jgi:hypothetical protein
MNFEVLITLLVMISAAGERGLEIVKNALKIKEKIPHEQTRMSVLLGINFLINFAITWGIWQQSVEGLPSWLQNWVGVFMLSLMACGGSNAMHTILGFAEAVKTNKKDINATPQAKVGFLS